MNTDTDAGFPSLGLAKWTMLLLSLIEIYCMFPFEEKGDFAQIGRFIVNAAGSATYALKLVFVALAFAALHRQHRINARLGVILIGGLSTPLLVLLIHGIVHSRVAIQRTVEAYLAGPQLLAAIFGR